MRRAGKTISEEEIYEILKNNTNGVLAVSGDDDYPYAVPLSYVYVDGKIFFHGSNKSSHKLDGIRKNPKVSFCVIAQDEIIAEDFNTIYKSVIVFGKATILTDKDEIMGAMMALAGKYSSDYMEKGMEYIKKSFDSFAVIELDIEHVTGKMGC